MSTTIPPHAPEAQRSTSARPVHAKLFWAITDHLASPDASAYARLERSMQDWLAAHPTITLASPPLYHAQRTGSTTEASVLLFYHDEDAADEGTRQDTPAARTTVQLDTSPDAGVSCL
jgi:hypothetical protein